MDEKKLEQVQSLEEEQLDDVSAGADGARVSLLRPMGPPLPVIPPAKSDKAGGSSDSW